MLFDKELFYKLKNINFKPRALGAGGYILIYVLRYEDVWRKKYGNQSKTNLLSNFQLSILLFFLDYALRKPC